MTSAKLAESEPPHLPRQNSALRIAVFYAIIAIIWIWFSDRLLLWLLDDTSSIAFWATIKGWLFVLIMCALLYIERTRAEKLRSRYEEAMLSQVEARLLQQAREELEQKLASQTAELLESNAKLRQHESDLADAQQMAHMGNWSYELATDTLTWSDEVYEIFGLTKGPEPLRRESYFSRVHPEEREQARKALDITLEMHVPMDYEARVLRPDGEIRHVHVRGRLFYDASGTAIRLFGMVHDITDRKAIEQDLLQSNKTLSAIIESSPVAILLLDPNGLVKMWSPAAERIFGWSAAEVIGKIPPTVPSEQMDEYRALWQRVLAGNTIVNTELKMRKRDGSLIDVGLSTATLGDQKSGIAGVTMLLRDITDRKRADVEIRRLNAELEQRVIERTAHLEQEIAERKRVEAEVTQLNRTLERQAQRLAEINRELETFTYSVSHDLKAPLRGIDGYSKLLQEDYADRLDEEGRAFLDTIRKATLHMGRLIDDLLAYSRLERQRITIAPVNVCAIVNELLRQYQDDARYERWQFVTSLKECESVQADADGLILALRNLIDNAIKFSAGAAEPRIEIAGQRREDSWLIWVKDNGVGFDMQYHDRIFEIFQRLHRAEDFPGTGVGLAIVRKAIQRMEGRIWAESEVGAGATFFLEIPA